MQIVNISQIHTYWCVDIEFGYVKGCTQAFLFVVFLPAIQGYLSKLASEMTHYSWGQFAYY